jgi:hypothetical protein
MSRFFMKRMLGRQIFATNSYTNFMKILRTVYSLMFGDRRTYGRMWSLKRTTQNDFYKNEASCLLCSKHCIFSFYLSGRAIVQAVSRRPTPHRPGFHPSSVYVRYVVDQVAMAQVFLRVLWVPLSV